MNTLTSAPLLLLEPLADRNKNPSALLLNFSTGEAEALAALLAHPEFHALSSRFPCLVASADLPPSLSEMLQAAGCRIIAPDTIYRTTTPPTATTLPSDIEWVVGNWYLAPPAQPSGNQGASRALALQLVQLVVTDADTHEIEAVLRRDPALSYHLLRVVNSLGMGMNKKITSFSQAILLLGRAQLRRWLNLMLFSSRQGDERSAMLLARVAVRASSMEALAKASGEDKFGQDMAFMAGMFSLLGVLFGMPLADVLRPLKISDTVLAALLNNEGDLGRLLALVEAAERGDLNTQAGLLAELQVAHTEFNLLLVRSHTWMLDVIRESGGGANA